MLDQAFSPSSLAVDYRKEHWSAAYGAAESERVESLWGERMLSAQADGRSLYDSDLFRLHSFSAHGQGVTLHLGDTSYKHYVATRSPAWSGARADPIGTAIILLSADGYVPLGHRSPTAEVNPGLFFSFGGFFDRTIDFDAKTKTPNPFACAIREIEEEIGLVVSPGQLTGLGIVYDRQNCHPELSFGCKLPLTRAELSTLDWSSELSDLTFIPALSLGDFVEKRASEIASTLVGGFQLFTRWLA